MAKELQAIDKKSDKKPEKKLGVQYKHARFLSEMAAVDAERVYEVLNAHPDGLTIAEAEKRAELNGYNEIAGEKHYWHHQLLKALFNPFIVLLTALAIISYFTDDTPGATVMATMVCISVCLTFFQEFRSSRAAEKLKAMVSNKVLVLRRRQLDEDSDQDVWLSKREERPLREMVPGDVVFLSAGDMIPGDIRLIHSKDLFVSQSSMTGESLPIEKMAIKEEAGQTNILELQNICFMGTNVVSGTAIAIILKTGTETYLGALAQRVAGARVQTSFDKGINRFTWLMLRFMMVMVPLVFLINGISKGNWFDAFMFAVAVAVGLTPEMLPMIVTVNLAKGAMAMARKKVIVKRLNAIQNFGAMDILCTDKTGTLTQDKVILEKYIDAFGDESSRVLKYAYLNSFYQTGLKNLLDVAILRHQDLNASLGIDKSYKKLDEIPFDFNRKRMSVVVEKEQRRHILICKGAIEEMFSICSHAEFEGKTVPIGEISKDQIFRIAQDLNDDGLRVIAVAYKDVAASKVDYGVKDECDLTLIGYVAFLDPAKESAAQAVQALLSRGVQVKVLTGDNERVTRKICIDVGIPVDQIILGSHLDDISDADLKKLVESVAVFAKLNPAQKERIVSALHSNGHVVGFMGDGINDAPALKTADVGISVDNAVDVAKESADIILLEKSLLVLEEGVIEGRKVFGNIIKYIKMGASSNFGNVFSVIGASIFLPFLPMLPVQLLTQNLLYDISQTAIPFDDIDPEYLLKPRRWEIGEIGRFMLFIGPVSSIFDYLTFALMWFVFKANTPENASLFQSGWFVEGLLSQTLVVHMIRTNKIPFIQSRASNSMIFMTVLIMAIGIYIPFSRFAGGLGLQPLPMQFFPWLVGMLVTYCILTQFVKTWFIKKYGNT